MNKNTKISIFIALIVLVFCYTFYSAKKWGLDHKFGFSPRHAWSLSIAFSELVYGQHGYQGYAKVLSFLNDNGFSNDLNWFAKAGITPEAALSNRDQINDTFQKVQSIQDVKSDGNFWMLREDKGEVTYYELAFKLFGFKVESLFHLYFLILGVSVLLFVLVFNRSLDYLNLLLIFLCAHFVVVASIPIVGLDLNSLFNPRFIPVLGICPTLHLILLLLNKRQFNWKVLLSAIFQISILYFVVHIRSSALQFVLCILSFGVLSMLYQWVRTPAIGLYVFRKVNLWVMGMVFLGYFLLKMHLVLALNFPYTTATLKHLFWHPIYIGLHAHPDAFKKYGIDWGDAAPVDFAIAHSQGKLTTRHFDYDLYEKIIKEEFLRIMKNDGKFVIQSYGYKLMNFFRTYFGESYGVRHYVFQGILLFVIVLGAWLRSSSDKINFFEPAWLVIVGFMFSLIPSMLASPFPALIGEPSLYLTMIGYVLLSFVLQYFFRYVMKFSLKVKNNFMGGMENETAKS